MSQNTHEAAMQPKNKKGKNGLFRNVLIGVAILIVILFAVKRCDSDEPQPKARTEVSSRPTSPAGGATSTRNVQVTYNVTPPANVERSMPAQGAERSDPVHVPSGFMSCRDAELGRGSYLTEYQNAADGEWLTLEQAQAGAAIGHAERYGSLSRAQRITVRFVPEGARC